MLNFSSPPYFELSGPSLTEIQKEEVKNSMNEIYARNVGQPVLYEWITYLNDYLADVDSSFKEESMDEDESPSISTNVLSPSSQPCPTIISGNSLVDRKSTFQAHVAQVFSKNEVNFLLFLRHIFHFPDYPYIFMHFISSVVILYAWLFLSIFQLAS